MKSDFKVIIAGSRTFQDLSLLTRKCDRVLSSRLDTDNIVIVSGTANGADVLGEVYAKNRGFNVMRFPADWTKHGRRAGYIRNEQILAIADAVIVFWDGSSKGSKHMMAISDEKGIPLRVIRF